MSRKQPTAAPIAAMLGTSALWEPYVPKPPKPRKEKPPLPEGYVKKEVLRRRRQIARLKAKREQAND